MLAKIPISCLWLIFSDRPSVHLRGQLVEVAIPRNLFAEILGLIAELHPSPVTSTA
jgi:hypothetical protein